MRKSKLEKIYDEKTIIFESSRSYNDVIAC